MTRVSIGTCEMHRMNDGTYRLTAYFPQRDPLPSVLEPACGLLVESRAPGSRTSGLDGIGIDLHGRIQLDFMVQVVHDNPIANIYEHIAPKDGNQA
jgi:hypothetical protein